MARRSIRSRAPAPFPRRRRKPPDEARAKRHEAREKMKIAIIGQQDFGKAVLEAFHARGDEIAGVFVAPEKEGAKPDPMKIAAQEKGLKVFQYPSLKSPEATQAMKELNPDNGHMGIVLKVAQQASETVR